MAIAKRSSKLAFMGITSGSTTTYNQLFNFTDLSVSKNAKEYSRQYVNEDFERTDVVGYNPSISYNFDYDPANNVHKAIVAITDGELVGDGAKVSIVMVDLNAAGTATGSYVAVKRDFIIVPDSEGDSMDAYTYSGTLKVNGDRVIGTATTTDEWATAVFVADA